MAGITLKLDRRADGGLRVHCPEIPGLVLSAHNPRNVMGDVWPAIEEFLGYPEHANKLHPLDDHFEKETLNTSEASD